MPDYLRSQIAKMAGLNGETLRYYEQKGLLQPQRAENGYRVYPEADLDRLNFIKRAKEAGFTLEEIRKTLQLFDYRLTSEDVADIMAEGVMAKLKEVDARIAAMTAIREILLEMHEGLRQRHACPALQPLLKERK